MTFLRVNLPLKIASLILAVGVWFYVRGEERPVQILEVPLVLQNVPEGLALAGDVTQTVSVRVRAPEVALRSLSDEPPLARADLSGLSEGDQSVRIGHSSLRILPGVEVLKITPEYVPIRLEKKMRRNVAVSARFAGEPAPGYVLGEVNVKPVRVTVEGPESVVKEAREVGTDVVRIDGRAQPFDVAVNLYPDRLGVEVISDSTAILSIDIHERYVKKALSGVAVEFEGDGEGFSADPESVEVTVEGLPTEIEALDATGLVAVVDLQAFPAGRKSARLIPRVVIKDVDPESRIFVDGVKPAEINVRRRTARSR